MTRLKICGIRSAVDLRIAVEAGADAVGFICGVTHISEDALSIELTRELASSVPPYIARVLVTHLTDADEILGLADAVTADHIQIHGLVELPTLRAVCGRAGNRRVIGVVHVAGEDVIERASQVAKSCHAVHLDSRTADRLGGTGQPHDWSISRKIVDHLAESNVPVILSGGLRPSNVQEAVRKVRPYAVDVNSGAENDAGDKDEELVRSFISLARRA